jgi:hypothetical protein
MVIDADGISLNVVRGDIGVMERILIVRMTPRTLALTQTKPALGL